MKRLILLLLMLFVIVASGVPADKVHAQKMASESGETATETASVDYTLQYPGILPDNPLYFLKAARDKVVSFLINDHEKKAEFNLLTSDKRVAASLMLANRGKSELAVTTFSKSNNYLEEAIAQAQILKKTKKNINPMLDTFKNAINKHEDIAVGVKSKVGKKFSAQMVAEEKKLGNFKKIVNKLIQ